MYIDWSINNIPLHENSPIVCYCYALKQGSPTPGPRTATGPWPVSNRAAQQVSAGNRASEASSVFTAFPITCVTAWAPPPVRSVAALDSHRSVNSTMNCACEGFRLPAPYENLMPDDLRWSWGGDASAGEWLQIQIIISREVWLHRDHNKSVACRLISKLYQWVASENKLRAPTDSASWWSV